MAPEIVSKKEYCGPPADVWALGVLLFALLCGRFPFRGQNDKELYKRICRAELDFPDHVSSAARGFLLKVFKREPEQRISTKEMLKDHFLNFAEVEYDSFVNTKYNSTRSGGGQQARGMSADGVTKGEVTAEQLKKVIQEANQKKQLQEKYKPKVVTSSKDNNMQQQQPKRTINMEAYHAYYNTNEG